MQNEAMVASRKTFINLGGNKDNRKLRINKVSIQFKEVWEQQQKPKGKEKHNAKEKHHTTKGKRKRKEVCNQPENKV